MKRINLPLIFDSFFAAVCAFLLVFTSVRYAFKNAALALVCGIAASLAAGALSFLYIRKKQNKRLLLSRDEKRKELLELHLSLLPNGEATKLLLPLVENGAQDGSSIVTENKIYFCNFCLKPLSADDIAAVIKFSTDKGKAVLCNKMSPEAMELADHFMIEYVTCEKIYFELKERDLLPQKYIFDGTKKRNAFKTIKARFNRKLTAPLFWSGLGLTAFSFFTFYPLYYIVSGGILLLLSAICLVFGK